jgi:tRNA pseudouridine38-40 synthase
MTLRLCVAYDGTEFAGYQAQRSGRTVQGVLEDALEELAGAPVRVRAAGRTDAGVHALGQVVSIADPGELNANLLMRAMPSLLPKDVAVTDAEDGPEGFDARRSAVSRTYVYLLWRADGPHPLYRKYAVWPRAHVDASLLSRSLQAVVGTHDFSSFARVREDQTPIRTVLEANAVADGPFVRIQIVGESFLHQMVRSIVGTTLEIATGRKPLSWLCDALEARDRSAAGPVAPAHGLTLVDVSYDGISWPRRPAVTWPWSDHVDVESQRSCA